MHDDVTAYEDGESEDNIEDGFLQTNLRQYRGGR
jgi:hypothetical protein